MWKLQIGGAEILIRKSCSAEAVAEAVVEAVRVRDFVVLCVVCVVAEAVRIRVCVVCHGVVCIVSI